MQKNNIIWAIIIVVIIAIILGIGRHFVYQKLIVEKGNTASNFDLNIYLPGKVILSTFTSGAWGKFSVDHTIALNWGLDYVGQNDSRPSGGSGEWSIDKNVLIITGPGGLAGKYDFNKMAKINVGDKVVYADQYNWHDPRILNKRSTS